MKGRSTNPPLLDPSRNIFLSIENRPKHSPTRMAPASLIIDNNRFSSHFSHKFDDVKTQFEAIIGSPYFAEGGFILYHGDCEKLLNSLADAGLVVPLTITSPPYNIGKPYETLMDVDLYVDWCTRWIGHVHRVTEKSGSFWLNLGYLEVPGRGLCVPISYLLWNRTPFYLLQEIVWQYGAGVSTKSRFCPRNEKWLFYVQDPQKYTFNLDDVRDPNVKYPNQKKNGKLRCNPLGKNPSDVWDVPKVTTGRNRSSKERVNHPAQFPLDVIDRIVKVSSNPGDVVLDPFSGSGSAGIAAVGNGRIYVGFELREDYCALTVKRFREFLSERPSESTQESLFLDDK